MRSVAKNHISLQRSPINLTKETKLVEESSLISIDSSEKAVFLAQASHEIKTPLASILGFAESLLSHGNLSEADRQDVIAIRRQSEYMSGLVKDLLDLARIESHRFSLNFQNVNIVHLVDDVIRSIKVRYQDKELDVKVVFASEMPQTLRIDPVRLQQVLNQVISNAFRFTFSGAINICVDVLEQANGFAKLVIQVEDSGIGIGPETQKRIFKPFMRGDFPEVQKIQGTGLGLPLAKSLMKEMQGSLKLIRSEIGLGSLFEISFKFDSTLGPRMSAEILRQEQPIRDLVNNSKLEGRHILVVDDSVDLRLLMSRYLNRAGAEVETSENGAEAVSKALRTRFDCILMDIRMPVMDGYEATQLLRQSGYEEPIIALTAQATEEDQMHSAEWGFTAFLSKPINMSYLKQILQSC